MSILKNDAGMIARRHVDSPRPRVAPSPRLRVSTMAPGEGVEPSSSGSKPGVLPVALSRKTFLIF